MYWFYFSLLIVAIGTPIFIERESAFLSEDMSEALLIFIVGTIGFTLYILKEYSLLQIMREKLSFQQKNTSITKDLSKSYSYIGEVNRKVDILKGMMERLVQITDTKTEKKEVLLWEILDTIKHVTQAQCVSLRTFHEDECVNRLEEKNDKRTFAQITDKELLKVEKKFFVINGIQGVARINQKTKVYLLFLRQHNDEIDSDILSLLMDFLTLVQKYVPKGR